MKNEEHRESEIDKIKRLPNVLRRYAKDVEKYGKPIDSGLPDVLILVAKAVESIGRPRTRPEQISDKTLRDIARLREKHTAAFQAQDWDAMRRIRNCINARWTAYHLAMEKATPSGEKGEQQ